jgi:CRP-like cAMP-binding protein
LYLRRASKAAQNVQAAIERSLQQWTLAEAFFADELHELSQHAVSRTFGGGEAIVRQGESGHSLFIILEGTVGIFKEDHPNTLIATLKDRDIFGEMSLLTGERRSATVRAQGPVEVLEIEKIGLQKVIARRPELSDKLAQLVIQRQAVTAGEGNGKGKAIEKSEEPPSLSGRIRQFFGL